MNCCKVFHLLLIIKSVFSYNSEFNSLGSFNESIDQRIFDPCLCDDLKCLGKSTDIFLDKTCLGIPVSNIKPIDPLFISDAEVKAFEGANLYFKDINILGFKKSKIYEFKLDKADHTVKLVTKCIAVSDADMKIAFTTLSKNFTGTLAFAIDVEANEFITNQKTNLDDLWKSMACKLIEKGYETVIHNMRMAAQISAVNTFFTDFE